MINLDHFPETPGVYLMKDALHKVLYVGKAKNLKKRVKSYFQQIHNKDEKTRVLVSHIQDIEFISTQTEIESLLLENNLIKKHKPKYNILLRDDKTYPYIILDLSRKFPKLEVSRKKVSNPNIEYYGPFPGIGVRNLIASLNHIFLIRDCDEIKFSHRSRPCLNYEIKTCTAPCVGYVSSEDYNEQVEFARQVLQGKIDKIIEKFEILMLKESERENFELAAIYRDQLNALKQFQEQQNVANLSVREDRDVLGIYQEKSSASFVLLSIEQGNLLGKHTHIIDPLIGKVTDYVDQFILQYYREERSTKSLLIPKKYSAHKESLERALRELYDKNIQIITRGTGNTNKVQEIATENAKLELDEYLFKTKSHREDLMDVKERLNLPKIPEVIECYDISNMQGDEVVASKVVSVNGIFEKSLYRKYIIRSTEGQDDFKSMEEVIGRRLMHTEEVMPDLIVIDGGIAQLNAAKKILDQFNAPIPICGLAKARTESNFQSSDVERSSERIFLPNRKNPIILRENSGAYRILVKLRNEAHRFAITFHRKRREKLP